MAHFYSAQGELFAAVPNKSKPGEYRDFTLSDARKHYERTGEVLYSSVSTELQILAKPELSRWFVEQALRHSLSDPWKEEYDGETHDEWIKRVALRANEVGNRAADYGTEIHGLVAEYLGGPVYPHRDFILSGKIAEGVCEWLHKEGYRVIHTERTVVSPELGVAGTIDLQLEWREKNILGDLKTTTKPLTYRREHGYQVAGYDAILGGWSHERHIFYIDRDEIGNISRELCVEPERDSRIWALVHQLWQEQNKWPPKR